MSDERRFEHYLERITNALERIARALEAKKSKDIKSFAVQFSQPINQGDSTMPISKLAVAGTQPMLDDQMTVMTVTPLESDGETPGALASGVLPTYTISPGTAATLASPNPDPTGLTIPVVGVKGKAGAEVITVSYTNPSDGTTATGTGTVVVTVDPAELDVASFSTAFSTPVAQTPASGGSTGATGATGAALSASPASSRRP